MNYDHKADRRLITGTGGSGKTTEFLRLLQAHRAGYKFVFDPEREVAHKLGWPVVLTVDGLAYHAARGEPVCFDAWQCDSTQEGFDLFCSFVWNFADGGDGVILLASDEVQDFTETGKGGIPASFKRCLQKGRRMEIDVLLISQSLGEAHDAIRQQLSHIITFRHNDALPLAWLAKNGFNPDEVRALKYPGGWTCRNRHNGEVTGGIGKRK